MWLNREHPPPQKSYFYAFGLGYDFNGHLYYGLMVRQTERYCLRLDKLALHFLNKPGLAVSLRSTLVSAIQ
ncbi:hypothetical protein SLE2022_344950 [Rubroshorea leprosula]